MIERRTHRTEGADTMTDLTRATSDRIIDALADRIINDDSFADMHDLPALRDLLTERAFIRLSIALDLCPYHDCDLETCDDDSRTCRARADADSITLDR